MMDEMSKYDMTMVPVEIKNEIKPFYDIRNKQDLINLILEEPGFAYGKDITIKSIWDKLPKKGFANYHEFVGCVVETWNENVGCEFFF